MPVAGPFTNASCIRPVELILRDTMKHPQELHDLLKWCVDYTVAYAEMFADEFGGGGCTICDPVSCADILGMRNYKKFSEPHLIELIEGLTQALGRKPGLHICGKTSPLWKEMRNLQVANFSVDNKEDLAQANMWKRSEPTATPGTRSKLWKWQRNSAVFPNKIPNRLLSRFSIRFSNRFLDSFPNRFLNIFPNRRPLRAWAKAFKAARSKKPSRF